MTAVAWREPRAVILSEAKDLARDELKDLAFRAAGTTDRGVTGRLATGLGELVLTLAREHTIQAGLSVGSDAGGEVFVRGRHCPARLTAQPQTAVPHTF